MKLITHLREGLFNLLTAKLRSVLALLGIMVGTASVVAMVSGGKLATNEAMKQFEALGTDLLALTIYDAPQDKMDATEIQKNLTVEESHQLIAVDENIREIAPYTLLYNSIYYKNNLQSGMVLGVTESFFRIAHVELEKGRRVSILDGYAFYCVIGQAIYEEIKKITAAEPVGQQLLIGHAIFTIVGVAKAWPENNFVYTNVNNAVLIPIMTSTLLSKYAVIYSLLMRIDPEADIELVKKHLTTGILHFVPNKKIYIRSAKEIIAHMTRQSEILTVFLGLIGGISLLVGGIGVMNIMLVSVAERRREIGIRLAVGARKADIRSLFLAEAIMLSLVGGILGVLIGIIISYIIAIFSKWQFMLFLLPPLMGFSVSVATGVFFGFYPAYKASQLDPIAALRSE